MLHPFTKALTTFILLIATAAVGQASPAAPSKWKRVWQDDFNGDAVNDKFWSLCKRGNADWNNTMSDDPRLIEVSNGTLKLKGIVNDKKDDSVPFLTAGLNSKGKYNFKYAKVQIRARFKSASGAWPALWMLGENGKWPHNGEIDLMEHLNFDNKVYQTLHSHFTLNEPQKGLPNKGSATKIDRDAWNTYGCEWDADKITFTVNGRPTHSYPRLPEKRASQFPFQQPFYFLLSMQIGGKWVNSGQLNPSKPEDYPAHLEIDWVRVYQPSK